MRFVVVGGTTFDVLAGGLDRLPTVRGGDEFTPQTLVELPSPPALTIGGNGGNVAYTLGRLERGATLVTCLGEDVFGRQAAAWLADAGVQLVRVPPHRTSCNLVTTDRDRNRYSFFHPVAFDDAALDDAAREVALAAGDHLHLAGFPHPSHETLRRWLDAAAAAGASTSLDIGPALSGFRLSTVAALADGLDTLFASREELAALEPDASPPTDPDEAARQLAERVRTAVVVKGGAAGAYAVGPGGHGSGTKAAHVPARPVAAQATVGAGDAFDAGFLAAMVGGAGLDRALEVGDAVAREVLVRGRGVLGAPGPDDLPSTCWPS